MTDIENSQSFQAVQSGGLQSNVVVKLELENVSSRAQLAENALSLNDPFSAEESIATVGTSFLIWEDSQVDRGYTAPINYRRVIKY